MRDFLAAWAKVMKTRPLRPGGARTWAPHCAGGGHGLRRAAGSAFAVPARPPPQAAADEQPKMNSFSAPPSDGKTRRRTAPMLPP